MYIYAIIRFLLVLIGGLDISVMIGAYNDHNYFFFGSYVMIAIWIVCTMVYSYVEQYMEHYKDSK